jgi:16S rRNA processing protein RimM
VSDELVTVGRVGRPHGIDGSFFVEEGSESPERFARGATLLVDGVPAEVTGSKRGAGGRFVIKLDRPVPRGATLAVRRDQLPDPEPDSYYVFQLVGLTVEEEGGRALGAVTDVVPGPANDALVLDSGLLLPLVESCVLEVDLDARRVLVARGFADAE